MQAIVKGEIIRTKSYKMRNWYTSGGSCDDLFEVFFFGLSDIGFGLNFSGCQHFDFFGASWFLDFSLQLLLWLSLWISLWQNWELSQSEVGLVLDQVWLVVISQTETWWSVASEGSSESVEDEVLGVPSVLGGDEGSEISSWDVGFTFVVDVEK
jgi:hypothetical protein